MATAKIRDETLVEHIVRLRRAEREQGPHPDVVSVRRQLERVAGPTVSRAMAARLLGVSQTALSRWTASGDIPLTVSPSGRFEVPLAGLIGLVEELEGSGRPLARVMHERQRRAQGLDVMSAGALIDTEGSGGHRGAELRALLFHRAVASRLDERLVRDAGERLAQWLEDGRIDPRYASEWQRLLAQPVERIAEQVGDDTAQMRDLRQSSPFAGVLNEHERRAVLRAVARLEQ